jgi:hypothetical protein
LRSLGRDIIAGARMALGAVGMAEAVSLGDTLNDCFRGPEGADGGGVVARCWEP